MLKQLIEKWNKIKHHGYVFRDCKQFVKQNQIFYGNKNLDLKEKFEEYRLPLSLFNAIFPMFISVIFSARAIFILLYGRYFLVDDYDRLVLFTLFLNDNIQLFAEILITMSSIAHVFIPVYTMRKSIWNYKFFAILFFTNEDDECGITHQQLGL